MDLGFKTIIVAASTKYFDEDFVGTLIDHDFVANLPEGVDPCGENGEFHTFCFDGPIFKHPVNFKLGEKTYKSFSDKDLDAFSKEMILHFIDNPAAEAAVMMRNAKSKSDEYEPGTTDELPFE